MQESNEIVVRAEMPGENEIASKIRKEAEKGINQLQSVQVKLNKELEQVRYDTNTLSSVLDAMVFWELSKLDKKYLRDNFWVKRTLERIIREKSASDEIIQNYVKPSIDLCNAALATTLNEEPQS